MKDGARNMGKGIGLEGRLRGLSQSSELGTRDLGDQQEPKMLGWRYQGKGKAGDDVQKQSTKA